MRVYQARRDNNPGNCCSETSDAWSGPVLFLWPRSVAKISGLVKQASCRRSRWCQVQACACGACNGVSPWSQQIVSGCVPTGDDVLSACLAMLAPPQLGPRARPVCMNICDRDHWRRRYLSSMMERSGGGGGKMCCEGQEGAVCRHGSSPPFPVIDSWFAVPFLPCRHLLLVLLC